MESTCLEQFSTHLLLGDPILDHMIQYVPNINNFIDTNEGTIDLPADQLMVKSETIIQTASQQMPTIISSDSNSLDHNFNKCNASSKSIIWTKIENICHQIVQDMNYLGISVIDNFMEQFGNYILLDIMNLYNTVDFTNGMLLNSSSINTNCNNDMRDVRGDLIYWITGNEPDCKHTRVLMKTLDNIIFRCNSMNNNGLMGVNSISSRTPAMVACYPANGTGYIKHADNSNGDGRCITCIYYLNKDWNSERDGGLLRIYPKQIRTEYPFIDIEPVFDRVIFFWSDRRNLHEVLPSKRMRFAITVWYFDDEERRRYRQVL